MKRILWSCLFTIIILSCSVILLSAKQPAKEVKVPEVMTAKEHYPILYFIKDDTIYNPMLPYNTTMDIFSWEGPTTHIDTRGFAQIYVEGSGNGWAYRIIDPMTLKAVYEGELKDGVSIGSGNKYDILLPELMVNYRYVLEITSSGKEDVHYYANIQTGIGTGLLEKKVIVLHQQMIKGERGFYSYINGENAGGSFYKADNNSTREVLSWEGEDFVKMNEPVLTVDKFNPNTGEFTVSMKFTVANRKTHEFRYWDFSEVFTGIITGDELKVTSYQRSGSRKNEPFYESSLKQWVLDQGVLENISEVMNSDNGIYEAIVYEDEVWWNDTKWNTVTKVFGFDKLDSDYVMDESREHGVTLLSIDDKGILKYMVYGYMADGALAGHNGIAFYSYNNSDMTNSLEMFVSLPYGKQKLEQSIGTMDTYIPEENQYYIAIDRIIYKADLKSKNWMPLITLPNNSYLTNSGLVYGVSTNDKYNQEIFVMHINSPTDISKVGFDNMYLRLIDTWNDQLVVGRYYIQDTYEYLNGAVFYPYESVIVIDKAGNVVNEVKAPSGRYFGNVKVDKITGEISATTYQRIQQNGASKIRYEALSSERVLQVSATQSEQKQYGIVTQINGVDSLLLKTVSTAHDEKVSLASQISEGAVMASGSLNPFNTGFEVYKEGQRIAEGFNLKEALQMSEGKTGVTVIKKNPDGTRSILLDSTRPASKLIDVAPISKMPELIRGCEITALTMFLNYNTGNTYNKLDLAKELAMDTTPYSVEGGLISFGDMHKGFVGSMSEGSLPGLGVYIEPLMELAGKYIDEGLYDISGSDFDIVLNLVGSGHPVLVAITSNYNTVPNAAIMNWKTPNGYMEVTYYEHSILITGYDENYVYFNDTNNGMLTKAPIENFKNSWEGQGSQAMVVIK